MLETLLDMGAMKIVRQLVPSHFLLIIGLIQTMLQGECLRLKQFSVY